MLGGTYYGAEYGGSIASILLNLPGTASTAVTCLDGHPLARQGRAGSALFTTASASFAGGILGILGILVLMLFSPLLSAFALSFGPADYSAVMVLGLVASAAVTQGSIVKGVAMVCVGILFGCVGRT